MDPENKPTREELKEEVLKVSKGLVGLAGFNLVSTRMLSSTWYMRCGKHVDTAVGWLTSSFRFSLR